MVVDTARVGIVGVVEKAARHYYTSLESRFGSLDAYPIYRSSTEHPKTGESCELFLDGGSMLLDFDRFGEYGHEEKQKGLRKLGITFAGTDLKDTFSVFASLASIGPYEGKLISLIASPVLSGEIRRLNLQIPYKDEVHRNPPYEKPWKYTGRLGQMAKLIDAVDLSERKYELEMFYVEGTIDERLESLQLEGVCTPRLTHKFTGTKQEVISYAGQVDAALLRMHTVRK